MNEDNEARPVTLVPPPTGVEKTRPEVLWGLITAVVMGVVGILAAFGFSVDAQQSAAILAALTGIGGAIGAAAALYPRVYSEASVQKQMNKAAETGDATITPPPARNNT